jgi:hypothetical protein
VKVRKLKLALLMAALTSGVFPVARVSAVSYPTDTVASTRAPWVAAIYLGTSGTGTEGFQRVCTGSLIDPRHILTAAHCVIGQYASDVTVALGGTNLYEAALYQVADYEVHARYTIPTSNAEVALPHDIALLRLSEAVVGIKPVDIAPKSDTNLRRAAKGMALYGWGQDQNGAVSEYLGYTKQRDFSAKAKKWFRGFNAKTQIAAGLQRRGEKLFSGACFGDSGGPLVGFGKKNRPYVLGVVSYGAESCKAAAPSVYTRVASYRSWITSARNKMAERASRTPIEYAVGDDEEDAQGVNSYDAEIVSAYVSTTPTEFAVKVYVTRSGLVQIPILSLDDHAGGEAATFAYVSGMGVRNLADAIVCPVTESAGVDEQGFYLSLAAPADCLYRSFGRTSFDLTASVFVFTPGATQYSGYDDVLVDFVSLYLP